MPEKARQGDEVTGGPGVRQGKVVKVKPDGTRVVRDRAGKLQEADDPPKAPESEPDEED